MNGQFGYSLQQVQFISVQSFPLESNSSIASSTSLSISSRVVLIRNVIRTRIKIKKLIADLTVCDKTLSRHSNVTIKN